MVSAILCISLAKNVSLAHILLC